LSSHLGQRKGKQRGRAREREREREKEGECHLNRFPKAGIPSLGCHATENAQPVSQAFLC
jgi:hypothetical protein